MRELWPYIVPLPIGEGQQYEVLLSLFKSKVSIDIMGLVPLEGNAYQKNIIEKLPYSNKTVIERLGSLVAANVLSEGMEKPDKRRVWVKWYKLTNFGRWMKLLLMPPQEIPREKIIELLRELMRLYLEGIIRLCHKHEIDPNIVRRIIQEAYDDTSSNSS